MWHERMVRLYDADVLGPSIHRTVARTIIQSEALYSVTVGATLVSYVTRSDIFYVGSCMVPPLVVRTSNQVSALLLTPIPTAVRTCRAFRSRLSSRMSGSTISRGRYLRQTTRIFRSSTFSAWSTALEPRWGLLSPHQPSYSPPQATRRKTRFSMEPRRGTRLPLLEPGRAWMLELYGHDVLRARSCTIFE